MANSLLQKNVAGFGVSASNVTLQYTTQNVAAGSLLAAWVPIFPGSGSAQVTISLSDDKNGSWLQANGYVRNANGTQGSIWYFANSIGGVKPTVTVNVGGVSSYKSICLHEYSVGFPTGVTVDGSGSTNTGNSSSPSTGTATVTTAGSIVLAGFSQGSLTTTGVAIGGNFTLENVQNNGTTQEGGCSADDVNASANEGASFTTTSSAFQWAAMCSVFKIVAGSSGLLLERRRKGLLAI